MRKRPEERLHAWIGRKQILCLMAGLFIGMAAQLWQRTDSALLEGDTLARGNYGQGDQTYSLIVEGLGEKEVPVEMVLSERMYTKQEAHKTYEAVMVQLPQLILGNNPSLEDVRQDLNLLTYLDSYGIRLRWESDEPELLDSFGELHVQELKQRGIGEQGIKISLHVRMTEGNWPEEAFVEFLKSQDELQSYTAYMKLPEEYQGQSLKYSLPEESVFVPVMGLGVAGAVLCFFGDQARQQNRTEERKRQLALDYPEVLSRLTIFLGAGMSIRTAWDKIALEYKMMVEQGRRRKRYVYEEMYETSCQMKGGVPEGKAFEEFGRRCGLQSYMKLGGLLEQNRKNGSKNLRNLLRTEMTDAFEQRKHQARRLGEEAGTKLLLPLFILLSVVMVMIAVPALMEFK